MWISCTKYVPECYMIHGWLNPQMQNCRFGGLTVKLYVDFPLRLGGGRVVSGVGVSNPRPVKESPVLYQKQPKWFPKWLYHVIFPLAIYQFISSPTLGTIGRFHFSHSDGCLLILILINRNV